MSTSEPVSQRPLAMTADADADGTSSPISVAATVVLLRGDGDEREVLMLERPDRGSFAGAWVFPGGRVDPADGDASTAGDEYAAAVAAGVRETVEETGLVLDPATLVATAVWTPPPGVGLRARTWFFCAPAPSGELALSAAEVVHAEWARPIDLLARHGAGELTLYPPTWVTLWHLSHAAGAWGSGGGIADYRTHVQRREHGLLFLWQGDDQYDDAEGVGPGRHRLDAAALPWVFEQT